MTDNTSTAEKKDEAHGSGRGPARGSRSSGQERPSSSGDRRFSGRRPMRRGNRKPRAEFAQKIINIRRVTRVVSGGRRFSFSVSVVIGDRKGSVGVGMGKAADTALAIEKAYNDAKRSMIKVPMNESRLIPHEVREKFASSELFIKPAPGKGIIAGSSVRTVLDLAGVTDVNAKIFSRSKNAFNNAKAAVSALSRLEADAKTKSE